MIGTVDQANSGAAVETALRGELALGDAQISAIAPVLRYLVANDQQAVFNDEIIARVRGMIEHVACQLLDARAEVSGESETRSHPLADLDALVQGFVAHPGFLAHVHALALEWQLAERLHARLALDPVLSPLLQALIGSDEAPVAANAIAFLAAQARFAQAQRRMQLPLTELPGDLLHAALLTLRSLDESEGQNHAKEAERSIRLRFDEGRSRFGLIARIVTGMGGGAGAALSLTHAGVAIFISALAMASGQDRDLAVLATDEGQQVRLTLAMRASGLKPEAIAEQFLAVHPGSQPPHGPDQLRPERAAALLAHAAAYPGG